MREILFRGKYIQRGLQKHASENTKWVYGSLILRDDYCCILESPENIHPMDDPYLDGDLGTIDGCATPIDPDTVGQFTGLVDKRGARIFEGDIVRWTWEKHRIIGHQSCYYDGHYFGALLVVRWLPAGYMLCPTNDKDLDVPNAGGKVDNYSFWNYQGGLEIVGNIHDNPDMIGGGEDGWTPEEEEE